LSLILPIDKELKPEMSTLTQTSEFVRRSLRLAVALSAICGTSAAVMSAQTPGTAPVQGQVMAPLVNFNAYSALPVAAAVSSDSSSSSTDADVATEASVPTDPLHLNAMQYGGRQRYGRPRYRGGNTNADGSNKWIFYGGAGLAQPSGNTWKYFTPSWGVQIGGGRQFSAHFAVPIEFDYDHMGLSRQAMSNQSIIYFGDPNAADNDMDANAHVWSFGVEPTYTLLHGVTGDGLGAYVLAGAGFYHKVTNFTVPQEEEYCDYYYGCGTYEVQGTFDHYTSNAPGFNAGFGVTYKFSHFSNERFYGEVRYVFIDNSQRTGITAAEVEANPNLTYNGSNFFPANSNRTTYFPIKFGVRF
jgi:hypothetical protein